MTELLVDLFPGYGLRCHRAIITICRLIGIKDMYARVTGSKNMINLTRGLFHGLARQVTSRVERQKGALVCVPDCAIMVSPQYISMWSLSQVPGPARQLRALTSWI